MLCIVGMSDANFVLIPEVPFKLEGEQGLLACLRRRLERRGHAVIVVAEGAGQDLMAATQATDASGNKRLSDIGVWLKDRISEDFQQRQLELNLKYIDPSYGIRSVPANPYDSVFCSRLAHNAVHAAMCGRTEMVVSRCIPDSCMCRCPSRFVSETASIQRRPLDDVLESTGQPPGLNNAASDI